MPLSDKSSHLNSDKHKHRIKEQHVWCGKNISDKTRYFQSEIHLQNRQQNGTALLPSSTALLPSGTTDLLLSGNGVNIIMSENTYNKLKVNPTENLEHDINETISTRYFPRFKFQVSYLARHTKKVNGEEEVFKRWIKSILNLNYLDQDNHNTLMLKLDDDQLEGSGFQFQEIEEVILEIYRVNDIQASSWVELPEKYKKNKSIVNRKHEDQFCFFFGAFQPICIQLRVIKIEHQIMKCIFLS